jgi:signal transduction histidine kinase
MFVVAMGTARTPMDSVRDPDALAFAAGLIGAAALAFWRGSSIVVAGVVLVTTSVYLARGYPDGPALLPGPLSLIAVGYRAPRRTAWIAAGALGVATVVARALADDGIEPYNLAVAGWVLAAALIGMALRGRSERAAAVKAERAHGEAQALSAERLRIAQDLHDSIAHAMATISVQSGVAVHLLDKRPGLIRAALEAIRVASGAALDELGAILGGLRASTDAPVAPRAPVPSLDQIDDLVQRARADGLPVTLTVTGDPTAIASPIGRAGYRVVQEALTNVRRHAGPAATATVEVDADGGALRIAVTDDGRPADATDPGFGLIGMRERVASTGGTLSAQPMLDGGFAVRAAWPAVRLSSSGAR